MLLTEAEIMVIMTITSWSLTKQPAAANLQGRPLFSSRGTRGWRWGAGGRCGLKVLTANGRLGPGLQLPRNRSLGISQAWKWPPPPFCKRTFKITLATDGPGKEATSRDLETGRAGLAAFPCALLGEALPEASGDRRDCLGEGTSQACEPS